MKDARRKQIEALVAQRDTVTMEELRETFGVSMNTVRSDVAYLVDTGAVEKIYGGVRSVQRQEVPLFTQRAQLRTEEKRRIARYAQDLIEDGDTLYIDAGTTTMHLIDFLDPAKHVTIVTGNLYVIHQAYDKPLVELIVLPGAMNRRTNSVSDVSTLEFLGRYQFAKAFMGASGMSLDGRLNVSTYIEYELKKLAVSRSREKYLLLDSSKIGGGSLMSYGSLEDMTEIIAGAPCPEEIRSLCGQKNVKLTIAGSY
ncbi:MAG: DeoR/GlpR family DNA-binding transcription regulator [Oscillospiraceae bacterium]|nr:DeoR/GlpR family DNA-binding transcription regulator [Oscillospiraceae bacterium]